MLDPVSCEGRCGSTVRRHPAGLRAIQSHKALGLRGFG